MALLRNLSIVVIGAGISCAASAGPLPAGDGKILRWNLSPDNHELTYAFSDAFPERLVDFTVAGFAKWQAVETAYLTFRRVDSLDEADIQFVTTEDSLTGTVPAYASYTYDGNGHLITCQVRSTSNVEGYNDDYLEHVMPHEIGHCLGLHHSFIPNAVMSYFAAHPTDLADDDRYSLTLLYPADGRARYPLGCASLRNPPDGGSGTDWRAFSALLTFVFVLAAWRIGRSSPPSSPNLLLAALMLVLGFWAKRAPLAAILSATAVYAVVQVANAVYDPQTIAQGVFLKVIVISILIKGIKASVKTAPVHAPAA